MKLIRPDWPAPARVRAIITTRDGGVSEGPYASLNLGAHTLDHLEHVTENRRRLSVHLPAEPAWLTQVHGTEVIRLPNRQAQTEADGSVSFATNEVCAVLTADCLPVLLCRDDGRGVAALHAGWRGLLAGVLERGVQALESPSRQMAYLGPAISQAHFEVGDEVRQAFLVEDASTEACFIPSPRGRWLADLYQLARQRLQRAGVTRIHGGDYCTYADEARFFSYRRTSRTGRMASLIWLADDTGSSFS